VTAFIEIKDKLEDEIEHVINLRIKTFNTLKPFASDLDNDGAARRIQHLEGIISGLRKCLDIIEPYIKAGVVK